jgi:hypothetical protein
MSKYDAGFHSRRQKATVHAAREVLSIVRGIVPLIQSAVDLGCGVGAWRSVQSE